DFETKNNYINNVKTMKLQLENKTAIITGAGSGIGRAIAKRFAEEGAGVVIAEIKPDAGKKVEEEIRKAGHKALFVETDVSKSKSVENMVNKTIEEFGKVDILVNDAGILIKKFILEMTEEDWDKVLDTNLKGAFLCIKHSVKYMIEQKKGKIVNIASMGAVIGLHNDYGYCASKGGIMSLTTSLGIDLAPLGINVNAIGPGVIDTPMINDTATQGKDFKKNGIEKTPRGVIGKPEDIASAALYLASDESDFVVGQTIFVDGGFISV
ncbi:MAG: glucose 1-dehydrogenase, partial [Acidobacteria bacterium]|nr:glucose 1-dehydrogenase [Acidobacteriota bacterium]